MDKDTWIKNIFNLIREISDENFQERIWIKGLGPEVSSYDEAISSLYDDYKFEVFLNSNINFSNLLLESLKKFNNELTKFIEKEYDDEIIKNKNWSDIIKHAKEIVEMFINEFSYLKNE